MKTNQWYSEAVVWASENGLVNGYSAALSAYAEEAMCWAYGTSAAKPVLSPKDPSTRAQIAAVICRYLQNITAEQ
ncbi:MAG: hypothetical protein IJX14_09165 [Clostridia bacterium]|nr:hypothetical protein [Clostridia bacterium]